MGDNLKNIVAIIAAVFGLAGTTFGVGAVIGRAGEVEKIHAQLDAHTQANNIGHPEVEKRIDEFKRDVRDDMADVKRCSKDAQEAAQTAAGEARSTHEDVELLLGRRNHPRPVSGGTAVPAPP